MINNLKKQLVASPTAYHVVSEVAKQLNNNGFVRLEQAERWTLKKGDKAYTVIDGSALIAFRIGGGAHSYNIVASHTDSPCFKLKANSVMTSGEYRRLNTEGYGSVLHYTWFDRPLLIAGRIIVRDKAKGVLRSVLVESSRRFVIPSLAIHLNREANKELKLNIRKDLLPLIGMSSEKELIASLLEDSKEFCQNIGNGGKNPFAGFDVLDYDLFLVSACDCFTYGLEDEFICAPRLDNQTSVFSSIDALIASDPKCIAMAYLADNEEVGSRTKQGAGATILKDIISRINYALGYDKEQLKMALAHSFMTSCDNSHAVHPNNAELADDTNKNYLNKGIVIKHHANQSYTTDAYSSAIIKQIFDVAQVNYQDFYNRSDLLSGGTLGAISSSQLSIRSVDIGLPQLAMHSAAETIGAEDYPSLIRGLTQFYNSVIEDRGDSVSVK